MRRARTALAVVVVLAIGQEVRAGAPIFAPPVSGGVTFGFSGRRFGAVITIGGYPGYYAPYYSPYVVAPPFYGPYPGVTVIGPPPVTTVVMPVRVIGPVQVAPPPPPAESPAIRDEDFPDKIVIRPRQQQQLVKREEPRPMEEPPVRPLPGQVAGEFRPIPADERARVQPERPPLPLVPDQPEKDPVAESARQVTLGRLAFAAKEFGRAERRFQQATQVAPKEPIPYFYLAQARFALGKYREASAAIHDGLRIFPDWPSLPVKVRELYQEIPNDYDQQLKQLEDALVRHKDDPTLLFVYAYQLWFDGRQAEARPLFRRAARLVANPFFIDLFLLGQPAGPVARR
jgi:hypothetical protein